MGIAEKKFQRCFQNGTGVLRSIKKGNNSRLQHRKFAHVQIATWCLSGEPRFADHQVKRLQSAGTPIRRGRIEKLEVD